MVRQTIKMTAYQTNKQISTYQKKVDIPQKQNVDIPSKNSNQSSVLVKIPRNKVSNQLSKNDIVNNHVSKTVKMSVYQTK